MEISEKSIEEIDEEGENAAMRKVEAALFISGRYLSLQELITLTDVNPILLKKILWDLIDKYKNSGISIIEKGKLWKMDVADEFSNMVNKLATGKSEFTKAEQETLAMIAYKQPMKQSVLIKIRGNKGYDHVKKFCEMKLLNKKKMGHTSELTLSEDFYDYFHLGGADELIEIGKEEKAEKKESSDARGG